VKWSLTKEQLRDQQLLTRQRPNTYANTIQIYDAMPTLGDLCAITINACHKSQRRSRNTSKATTNANTNTNNYRSLHSARDPFFDTLQE
jgi:hypothetical protein